MCLLKKSIGNIHLVSIPPLTIHTDATIYTLMVKTNGANQMRNVTFATKRSNYARPTFEQLVAEYRREQFQRNRLELIESQRLEAEAERITTRINIMAIPLGSILFLATIVFLLTKL